MCWHQKFKKATRFCIKRRGPLRLPHNFAFLHHALSHTKNGNQHQLIAFYNSKLYQEGLSEEAKKYLDNFIEYGYDYFSVTNRARIQNIKKTEFRDGCLDFTIGYAASIGFQALEQSLVRPWYSDDSSPLKKCALGLTSLGLKAAYYYGLAKLPCFSQAPYQRIAGSASGSYGTSDCKGHIVLNCIEIAKIMCGHACAWAGVKLGPQEVKNFFRIKS